MSNASTKAHTIDPATEKGLIKKGLENSFFGPILVPLGLIALGSLIVFGVVKILSSEKNHRDLVRELHSKTFGNRWVAAFELSKVLAAQKIPQEEIPWLTQNLGELYQKSPDARTRNFIIMALGSLKSPTTLKWVAQGLKDEDNKVVFSSLVALGNTVDIPEGFDWSPIRKVLDGEDQRLVQAALLTLAQHRVPWGREELAARLDSDDLSLRYAAITGLINYKDPRAIEGVLDILNLPTPAQGGSSTVAGFNSEKVTVLKINCLRAIAKVRWEVMLPFLEKLREKEENLKLATHIDKVVNSIKTHD